MFLFKVFLYFAMILICLIYIYIYMYIYRYMYMYIYRYICIYIYIFIYLKVFSCFFLVLVSWFNLEFGLCNNGECQWRIRLFDVDWYQSINQSLSSPGRTYPNHFCVLYCMQVCNLKMILFVRLWCLRFLSSRVVVCFVIDWFLLYRVFQL